MSAKIITFEEFKKRLNGNGHVPPGGGDPPMDEVALEKRFGGIESKLDGIDIKLDNFKEHYATKEGLANLKFQIWAAAAAAVGLIKALDYLLTL